MNKILKINYNYKKLIFLKNQKLKIHYKIYKISYRKLKMQKMNF